MVAALVIQFGVAFSVNLGEAIEHGLQRSRIPVSGQSATESVAICVLFLMVLVTAAVANGSIANGQVA